MKENNNKQKKKKKYANSHKHNTPVTGELFCFFRASLSWTRMREQHSRPTEKLLFYIIAYNIRYTEYYTTIINIYHKYNIIIMENGVF